jgi:hypothetical protein
MKDRHAPRCLPFSPCRMAGALGAGEVAGMARAVKQDASEALAGRTVCEANI